MLLLGLLNRSDIQALMIIVGSLMIMLDVGRRACACAQAQAVSMPGMLLQYGLFPAAIFFLVSMLLSTHPQSLSLPLWNYLLLSCGISLGLATFNHRAVRK